MSLLLIITRQFLLFIDHHYLSEYVPFSPQCHWERISLFVCLSSLFLLRFRCRCVELRPILFIWQMLPGTLFLLHINTNNNVVFCVLLSKLEHIAHYKAKQQTKHIKKTKKIAQASGHTNHTRAHTHTHIHCISYLPRLALVGFLQSLAPGLMNLCLGWPLRFLQL